METDKELAVNYRRQTLEEIARAWASIDGKGDLFDVCLQSSSAEEEYGYYGGYMAEAQELISRSPMLHGAVALLIAHLIAARKEPSEVLKGMTCNDN